MALDKDWKDYDPVTGIGDPSTPITAVALEDLEARAQAAINAFMAVGRPVYELASTAIILNSTHFNSEIVTTANSPVTVKIPINLGGSGSVTVGIRQGGTGTVNIIWDAGVTVGAPNGTQIKGVQLRGQITWLLNANQYTLEGEFIQSGAGSGGGGGGAPGGGVVPVPTGFLAASAASVATGTSIPIPSGGVGDRTYVAVAAWDTGSTPDISALITTATSGWVKREAGYGTSNGGAVFTADVATGVADPAALVLTWTGGARTTFNYVIGVYNDAEYLDSDVLVRATADALAPTFPSVSVQAGGEHVVAATNSAGLASDPPSGYTERVDLSTTGVAQYANVTVDPWASSASGALTVVPPPGSPGETYIAVVHYDNLSGVGDASANIILDSPTGDWTKEATKWQSPQGSAVFYHHIAAGDVDPTVQFTGAARTVGYVCVKVTDVAAADAIQATAVGGNASSDASNAIFPTATDMARGLRMLVAFNNAQAAIAAPQSYTQRANFVNEGAVFTRPSTGVTADPVYVARWDDVGAAPRTSFALTKPTGAAVGDVHILMLYADAETIDYTISGWTLIRSDVMPSNPARVDLYYRIEDGSAFQEVTWSTTLYASARVLTYRNVDPVNPIHVSNGQLNTASTTVSTPTVTTTVDGCMLLWIGTNVWGQLITGPATYTGRYTGNLDTQPYEKLQTTAGAVGVVTGTQPSSNESLGAMLVLRPAKMSATTALLSGANRLWHAWSIIVKPATAGLSLLGLALSDRAMTATGASGILSPSMPGAVRSSVAFSVSLAPSGTVTDPDPDPDPAGSIVTALSVDGSGVVVVSVPTGTVTVTVAEMDNIATPAVTNYYSLPVATATAGGYKYVPHAGTPVVDMIAVDAVGESIPPPPTDAWAGRLTTNVVNTPGVSLDNTTVPPSASITDNAAASWTLGTDGIAYRNAIPTISSEVVQILFKYATPGAPSSGIVYQKNIVNDWYRWDQGSTAPNPWVYTTDPTGAVPPPPPPPPGGGGGGGTPGVFQMGVGYRGSPSVEATLAASTHPKIVRFGVPAFSPDNGTSNGEYTAILGWPCKPLPLFFWDNGLENTLQGAISAQVAWLQARPAITYVELGNENTFYAGSDMTASGSTAFNNRAKAYAAYVKALREALDSAGLSRILLLAQADDANQSNPSSWVNNMKAQVSNLNQYVHWWTIHPYGVTTARFEDRLDRQRSQLNAVGWNGNGKAITEWGIPTDEVGGTPRQMGNYGFFAESYAQANTDYISIINRSKARGDINLFLAYQFVDQQASGSTLQSEHYYGIARSDGSSKGALTATMANFFANN